jgi:hypothetical protein
MLTNAKTATLKLRQDTAQRVGDFVRFTNQEEDSHDEDDKIANPVLLRPSSVVRAQILTKNGSIRASDDFDN